MDDEPPCFECHPVPLTENETAYNLFPLLMDQLRTGGMGDPLGVDYNAIKFVFDLYDVTDRRAEFEKLVSMFREYLGRMTEKKGGSKEPDYEALECQYNLKSPGTQ